MDSVGNEGKAGDLPAVFHLYKRFAHHSSHSGYDQLCQYVGDPIPALSGLLQHSFIRSWMDRYASRRGYDPIIFYPELWLALSLPWRPPAIFHHLYSDYLFRFFSQFPGAGRHRVLATFHTIPESKPGLFSPLKLARICQLDAAVVVGRNQIDFFANLMGAERVFFVPCGVHTGVFIPPDENQTQYAIPTVLSVGQTERDFRTYYEVVKIVHAHHPQVRFLLVANPEGIESNLAKLESLENFEFRSGIDEAALIEAYQRSHLMYLPLSASTANLGLLEGMSCGMPVVVTGVGGVLDYVCKGYEGLVPPGDAGAAAEMILDLLMDEPRRKQLGASNRAQVLRFDWAQVAKEMKHIYRSVWEQAE